MNIDEAVTVQQAAEMLGYTDLNVRRLIKARILEAQRFGRTLMISRASVEKAKRAQDADGILRKADFWEME